MSHIDPISIREAANTPWGVEVSDPLYRKVLDHGSVRLVDKMGSDVSIARSARVSYAADWRAGDDKGSDTRLIHYLLRNGHTSPFEHVVFTFDVKAPIFVLRQWMRHRTWSYNEVSARYTELPEEYYVPEERLITEQATDNKQGRTLTVHKSAWMFREHIKHLSSKAFIYYQEMLKEGLPRELARTVLPLNTYSHMFATVNLHNLFKFIAQRQHGHAQYEIRVYADALLDLITPIVPVAVATFKEYNKNNVHQTS